MGGRTDHSWPFTARCIQRYSSPFAAVNLRDNDLRQDPDVRQHQSTLKIQSGASHRCFRYSPRKHRCLAQILPHGHRHSRVDERDGPEGSVRSELEYDRRFARRWARVALA